MNNFKRFQGIKARPDGQAAPLSPSGRLNASTPTRCAAGGGNKSICQRWRHRWRPSLISERAVLWARPIDWRRDKGRARRPFVEQRAGALSGGAARREAAGTATGGSSRRSGKNLLINFLVSARLRLRVSGGHLCRLAARAHPIAGRDSSLGAVCSRRAQVALSSEPAKISTSWRELEPRAARRAPSGRL